MTSNMTLSHLTRVTVPAALAAAAAALTVWAPAASAQQPEQMTYTCQQVTDRGTNLEGAGCRADQGEMQEGDITEPFIIVNQSTSLMSAPKYWCLHGQITATEEDGPLTLLGLGCHPAD